MRFLENLKSDFKSGRWLVYACGALFVISLFGYLADFHWFFDIFVNFKLQYLLGCFVLLPLCLFYRRFILSVCLVALAAGLYAEVQSVNAVPFAKPPQKKPNFTLVQYNKYYYSAEFDKINEWIRRPDSDFDVMIINESSPEALKPMADMFGDVFPHQYPDNFLERFNDISVLSKWPYTIRPLPMDPWNGETFNVSKINLYKEGLEPIVIFAYHTQTPIGPNDSTLRNFELENFAAIVAKQAEKNAIMVGDWNITPYSPRFKDILTVTGLKYQTYGLLPPGTWPSYLYFSFLKIPIDQILFSKALELVSLETGPTYGSDHQSLIAKFAVPAQDSAE